MTWQCGASSLTYNGGVSGSWTNGGSGWLDGVAPATWNNATPDAAIFGGGSPTSVNVDGGVTAGNISVSSGTYTLGGAGTLTLSSTAWDVASGLTNSVSTALGGTTGLIKSGAGVLLFSGTNKNFTGSVTINGGAIQIASAAAGALGSANNTAITLNGGGLYTSFAADTTVNYAITVTNSGELRNAATGRFILASSKLNGAGTLTLSFGTNNTRFQMGTTTQAGFNGKWVIDSGGSVDRFVDVDGTSTFGNVSGDDAITLINSGAILFRETRTQGTTYGITVGNGGGKISAGGSKTVVLAAKLSGAAGNTLTLGVENGTVLVLSNTANSYLGDTAIVANNSGTTGIVRLGLAGVIPDAGGAASVGSGTTLDLNGFSETIGGLSGTGTVSSSSGVGALSVGGNNANSTFSGILANGAGTLSLSKVGTGTLTLAGTNNTHSGGTTVRNGRLLITNAAALGAGNVTIQAMTGGGSANRSYLVLSNTTVTGKTLTLDSTTNRAVLLSTGSSGSTWDGTITLAGGTSAQGNTELTADTGNGPLTVAGTINGSISGGGFLTLRGVGQTNVISANVNIGSTTVFKDDTGTWRVASSGNTWGSTTINSGILLVGASDALPDSTAVSVASAGTLDVGGYNETVGSIAGAGKIDNSGAAAALAVGGDNTSTTFSGVLTNSGSALSLTKAGNGTLTLSGNNSYSGGTTISAGTLRVGNGGTSGSFGSGNVTNSGGTLVFDRSDAITVANLVSGGGPLTQAGSGTLTLMATNTYTGATTVEDGKLVVNGSISSSSVSVQSGAALGGTGTVGSTVVNSGASIAPGNSPGNLTINGDLTWNNGGSYDWEVLRLPGEGSAGTDWDLLSVTGSLNLTNLTGAPLFNINLLSLSATNSAGPLANWSNTGTYAWKILQATNAIANFNPNYFNVVTTDFSAHNNISGGLFALELRDNDKGLYLTYSSGAPVPEPGTWAAAALMVTGTMFVRWRRRLNRAKA